MTLQANTIDKQGIWIGEVPITMKKLMPSWNRQKMVVESSINFKQVQ